MKKYRIGDMSRMASMPKHVIRFYETQGIVNPKQQSENNYRYYEYYDTCSLLRSRLYRSLGFSLHKSAELIGKCSHDELHKQLERRSVEIEEEISRLQCQQSRLKEMLDRSGSVEDCLGEYRIIERPGFYWIGGGNKEDLSIESASEKIYRSWMEKMPSTYFLCVIPIEAMLQQTEFNYSYGVALKEENIKYSEVENIPQVKYFPACRALYGVIEKKHNSGSFTIEYFKKLLDYIYMNKLKIEGPLLIELIEIIFERGMKIYRFGISIPVRNIT
ncbi:HTH-type transcriptional regulator CueR [Oxobacter pfennigii]|uniref:HTH-type transcriptional regulator CueR n=1 Tax=Oxobacter pfennigii TaxID=36849 RepID=A0A0P9ACJ6_9CLOT|nr:MerR family transcriptional regulator [Oxobacter pfennigii]KPU42821.1 HTH-type transcriptional regulator CueR [Oxobacter pfennigii]